MVVWFYQGALLVLMMAGQKDMTMKVRVEYHDGTMIEYTFRDGRCHWVSDDDKPGRGHLVWQVPHSTTRKYGAGYIRNCVNSRTDKFLRVTAFHNGNVRVLRAQ